MSSVLISWRGNQCSIEDQFAEADKRMYQPKAAFYSLTVHRKLTDGKDRNDPFWPSMERHSLSARDRLCFALLIDGWIIDSVSILFFRNYLIYIYLRGVSRQRKRPQRLSLRFNRYPDIQSIYPSIPGFTKKILPKLFSSCTPSRLIGLIVYSLGISYFGNYLIGILLYGIIQV